MAAQRAAKVAAHTIAVPSAVKGNFVYADRESLDVEDVREMVVQDARAATRPHDIHRDGFCMVSGVPTHVVDPYDKLEVERVYYKEVEELLKKKLGAKRVIPFDHIVRNKARLAEETAVTGTDSGTTPFLKPVVQNVHNDYTVRSGLTRAAQLLAPHDDPQTIEKALSGRFAIVNVWRPLATVVKDPLAMLSWELTQPEDVQTIKLVYTHREGEVYRVFPSDRHQWSYWSHMDPSEVLLFKTFDSETAPGVAQFALHSAFAMSGQSETPERQSIEVRTLVFFDDDAVDLAPAFRAPHLTPSPDSDSRVSLVERKIMPQVPGQY